MLSETYFQRLHPGPRFSAELRGPESRPTRLRNGRRIHSHLPEVMRPAAAAL
ncbi:hypothetical protein F751_0720 [Auxenochlorella protothecoides]|uniref:Uncharacterized protein n=1 Tax=Auxenochlorella protothecoides TaxID=3075 RepID=A0A087SM34_AUXPR|nr:hypothetical protein F751_0720 [Auxenochlorella protothecoides]KFM26788.1 hypothetical protein F751_0720 [Auxenochlorella protothecoides]